MLVVPTVDTVEEAREAVNWAYFPPLGRRSLGGGNAFGPTMWGSVPGGYRNTINDNLVLPMMILIKANIKMYLHPWIKWQDIFLEKEVNPFSAHPML